MTTRRVLLGLFILWQLAFVVGTNVNEYFRDLRYYYLQEPGRAAGQAVLPGWPDHQGRFAELSDTAADVSYRYTHLTGQEQIWVLFSPGAMRTSAFVALELRWADGRRVVLPSPHDPESPEYGPRPALSRLRRSEGFVLLTLLPARGEDAAATKMRYAGLIVQRVRAYSPQIQAFLEWRWRQYLAEHPGTPTPDEIVMVAHCYRIAEIDEAPPNVVGPVRTPVLRWRPGAEPAPPHLSLEAYDPVSERFVRVKKP